MIKLSATRTGLIAAAKDAKGTRALSEPLHRVFLRGTLKAAQQDGNSWEIPWRSDQAGQLTIIINHFEKYGLLYETDDHCKKILERLEEEKRAFRQRLDAGLAVKKGRSKSSLEKLRTQLCEGFVRRLTEPQLHAVQHLIETGNSANFSVPGSGKTSIALAYLHMLRSSNSVKALLVIGPISSFEPWEHEYEQCFGRPAKSERISGHSKAERRELYLTADDYELLLVSYHTAARDVEDLIRLLSRRPYLVVLDESHYVKRPVGGKLAEAALLISEHAQRRVILTGTPMPNGLPDLWSQFTFLWPKQLPLGTADTYLRSIQGTNAKKVFRDVKRKIDPLFFRITKSELGLPKPNFKLIKCTLKPLQWRIYTGVAERFLSRVREAPHERNALREWRKARAVRLLQVAVNPVLLRHGVDEFRLPPLTLDNQSLATLIARYGEFEVPSKIEQACAVAREVCEKRGKVIIWSTFVHNLTMLEHYLKDLNPVVVHGGVPYGASEEEEQTREWLIRRFKQDQMCQALIANPAACAESISLHTVCHDAIYVDRSFNCAHYLQSLDRIHRLGLSKDQKTTYYLLLGRDTIDEIVHTRLLDKMQKLQDLIEGDLPGAVAGYWSDDLGEEEEERDFSLVEQHISRVGSGR